MKGIQAIASILKSEGVEYLSCFPVNPLIDAAIEVGIRPIMTRCERVAVNIADGYVRVSDGRQGIACAVQSNAGIENSFAGMAQAYADGVPILMLPLGNDRHSLSAWPNFEAVPNYAHVTKWAAQINFADRVPELMGRAFTNLRMGRPGPVLLEIPADVAAEHVEEELMQYSPVADARSCADPDMVREAVSALLAARRPIIHAGQGALYAGAWDELHELAELLHLPVMTTMNGKSAFREDHPLALGFGGVKGTKMAAHFLRESDLVLGIGCSFGKTLLAARIPPGKIIIHATVDEADINKDCRSHIALIGDAKLVLRQLIDEVQTQANSKRLAAGRDVVNEIRILRNEWMGEWMPKLTSSETPINPYRVIWDMMQTIDPGKAIVTHDSGHPRDQLSPFYVSTTPRGYLGWGHTTQLGHSLGLIMGAKLAAPDKITINVTGDGGFGMVGTDFETAVRNKIPILTIMLNNSVLCGYEKHMPVAVERLNLKRLSGEYAKMADALGGYAEKVESPDEIVPAIERALNANSTGRPALIEFITREETALSSY